MDRIYHSDTLYSAVCSAMSQLGLLEDWLEATSRQPSGSAVRFSSCFPYQGEVHFVAPPRNLWPPPPSTKVRWKGARFVPLSLVESLLRQENLNEDRWAVDGASGCLVPVSGRSGFQSPFRVSKRSRAAVDRMSGEVVAHETACLEFGADAGIWTAVVFSDEAARTKWLEPVQASLRVLADSGIGGERSSGWGHAETPEFIEGHFPDMLLRQAPVPPPPEESGGQSAATPAYWMLSLFSPGTEDLIDWGSGSYSFVTRGGRVESAHGWGAQKKLLRMVTEGSVLVADQPPQGHAPNVAPEGFAHPVFRAGFALGVAIPWRMNS